MRLGDFLILILICACLAPALVFLVKMLFWGIILLLFGISDLLSI